MVISPLNSVTINNDGLEAIDVALLLKLRELVPTWNATGSSI